MPEASLSQLALNLAAATAMVTLTTLFHLLGLLLLIRLMGDAHARFELHRGHGRRVGAILVAVFGVFALHTMEIWSYAVLYRLLGELRTFEEALYFSTVTFVSLGYGDVVLTTRWRVLSAIEAANGVILIAWSTAFLLTATARLKLLGERWFEPTEPG
jgi:hypothetical protein